MNDCICNKSGYCEKYKKNVTDTLIKVCNGTSELSPEKQEFYKKCLTGEIEPGIIEKGKNFTKSLMEYALSGFKRASEDTLQRRVDICKSCEFFDSEKTRCLKCGCYLNIKAGWQEAKCPLNKWPTTQSDPESPNA